MYILYRCRYTVSAGVSEAVRCMSAPRMVCLGAKKEL